jgi:hypothetical protein
LGFLALPPIYIYWGHKAQKFTEAIPGWIDTHVDKFNKARADLLSKAIKPLEHIPVVGKAAQGLAWMDGKMNEFTGGIVKGAGSMVGGIANMVTHPVETASGLYAMAEHMPIMGGLVPNPLKLAHAGTDIIFSGADPKTRLESVLNPAKSMEEDAKFGKALLDGFIEPYKKSWSEGKYFEVAGRATFDIGSMFIGAGEANAAIKGGTAASRAAKVANVVDKTGDAANIVGRASKFTEVTTTAGKAWQGTKNFGTEALHSAKRFGTEALHGVGNFGDNVVVGAKNLGNRTLNTIDNIGYEARSWLSDKFPGFGEPELAGIGNGLERPTPRPMQSVPERNQPMRMEGNGPDGPESGYDRVYPSATDKPRGMPMDLEEVRARYGEDGVNTVERTHGKADEIASAYRANKGKKGTSNPGPVLSGVTDPMTGKTYFGQNFKKGEIDSSIFREDFKEGLPDVLKQRLETYTQKLDSGEIKVESSLSLERGGIPGSHAEIRALSKAIKAREALTGRPVTEAELPEFLMHNRNLLDKPVPAPEGVPPRCVHCWNLTDGVTVIGND